jgi:hypothetical protein
MDKEYYRVEKMKEKLRKIVDKKLRKHFTESKEVPHPKTPVSPWFTDISNEE